MINDRLKELEAKSCCNDCNDSVVVISDDLEKEILCFLEEVKATQDMLVNIQANTSVIRTVFDMLLGMPGAHDKKKFVAERQSVVNSTIRNVKSKLENMEISVKNVKRPAQILQRIHAIHMNSLYKILAKLTEDYLNMLDSHKKRCAAIMKQQIAICNHEGEYHELLDKDASVFVDNIIADTLEAKRKLNIIPCLHEQLQKTKASTEDIRDLFVELTLRLETQGEKMNCVRYLIEKEAYTITTGAQSENVLTRAVKKCRQCRKISLVLGLTSTIFGLILLLVIF